jgi:hypothetical protein
MVRRVLPVLTASLLTAGCVFDETQTAMVPSSPFGRAPLAQPQTHVALSPASLQVAARVDTLGREILAANPQLGIRPMFQTISAPDPELFHNGTKSITLTEGLVNQCKTQGQLAAVLCLELGQIMVEHVALAAPPAPLPERPTSMEVRIGNDYTGASGPPDQSYRAEAVKYEQQQRERAALQGKLDAKKLALGYLTKAGYTGDNLAEVVPLLDSASENRTFTRQMLAPDQNWR